MPRFYRVIALSGQRQHPSPRFGARPRRPPVEVANLNMPCDGPAGPQADAATTGGPDAAQT